MVYAIRIELVWKSVKNHDMGLTAYMLNRRTIDLRYNQSFLT